MSRAKNIAENKGLRFRLMFQDEARFGRISDPRNCWAPKGIRPEVPAQIIREYTYLYGAYSPKDGVSDHLILPYMDSVCMNLFLKEVSDQHKDEFILMIYDGAPCHSGGVLEMPENMMVETLPPYCPQINPSENMWEEIREKFFPNLVFDSMQAVEDKIIEACVFYQNNPQIVQSITGFNWIIPWL